MTAYPQPHRPFDTTLPMLLLRAREALIEPVRARLRLYGLTDQQWRVIRVLASVEEMDLNQLSRSAFLRPPSMTRIVRDLVARGYVERRIDPKDRRAVVLAMRPAGRALIAEALPEILGLGAQMRDNFGPERLEALRAMLLELIAAVDDPAP